ncbi:hypothetical protein BDR26DRAFT_874665 [Obelidium mucronatum]|nr:hypothetical protein BDR26DRAFT_874665 [Obelidium mucronatum]
MDILTFDILEHILVHLPIDACLTTTALASKQMLAPFLLASVAFARRHVRLQHQQSHLGFWKFLETANLQVGNWQDLPVCYRIAIYREVLQEPASSSGSNEARPRHWRIRDPLLAHKISTYLINDSSLVVTCNENRSIVYGTASNMVGFVRKCLTVATVDPCAYNHFCIKASAQCGFLETFKLLMADPRVDPNVGLKETNGCEPVPIIGAAVLGHSEIVKILLSDPRVDPRINDGFALWLACRKGHVEIVRLFLEDGRVDPTSRHQNVCCLAVAARTGNLTLVNDLMECPRVIRKEDLAAAAQEAISYNHLKIARFILSHKLLE